MALRPRRGMFELPEDVVPTAVKPASTTKQKTPVGIPSSDPVKTQPGETGPFDPNAAPPTSSTESEVELAPPKPLPETKEPTSEPEEMTFTFIEGRERGGSHASYLWNQAPPEQVTVDQLREYFYSDDVNRLPEVFGTFDNYLAYMTEREQLIQSGEYGLGNWGESRQGLDETQLMILEGEDLWQSADPNDPSNPQYIERVKTLSQKNEYERWINSDVNKALLEKYGVSPTVYSNSGDKFQWNGSGYVKTVDVSNRMSVGDIAKLGFAVALSVIGTPALASALAPSAAAGSTAALAANAAASSIINSATQLLTTGSLDIKDALQAGATSVLTSSALNALEESGIYDSLQEAVGGTTTDQLLDVDGNVIGEIVRDSAGQVISSTGVSANEWYTYATELGGVIQEGQTIAEQLSTVLDVVPDWLYDAGFETAEAINNAFEETRTGISPTGTGEEAVVVPSTRDIFADTETTEEDIFTDTTQEATGLEESAVRELLNEYIEPVLASLEDQDEETAGIQTAIGTITEQQQETLQEFVRQGGQIEELDSNQQQIIEDLGGVNQVVGNLAENVSGLEEGLQQAATEREDIRASQEAGFTQAEQDRQRLMEAIVEARGQTTELSQEMRDLLAQSNQTMQELFEGTDVDIDELRSGQLSQEEATNALREYTEQELGVVREELAAGLTEAQQERYDLAQDLIEVGGLVENLDAASQERFDELDITVDSLAEEFGVDFDRLEQGLLSAEEATDALQEYAEEEFGAVREDIAGLEERIDANTAQQLEELTGLRSEFLATLSASEAAAIARNQGLSDQLTEQITGVRGETAAQIEGINERLTDRISAYEQQTGEQLDIAAEERAELGGQLGTLTEEVANIATDLINVGGDIENLDQRTQDRLDELGLGLQDLGLLVNVNFEALQQGMLTQESAMQELIEETTRQTEESLTERLEQAEEGFATSLSDTEANLLSQITGVEAGVLQQLAEVEGGLQSQFGEQFGQVQEQVAGLGEQVAGVGEGLGQLGQALGTGLLGLAAAQPTAQQIAAAMPRQPVKFDPFLKGLSPFQPLTPIALAPQKQTDAMSELNKFIGRQTGMLV